MDVKRFFIKYRTPIFRTIIVVLFVWHVSAIVVSSYASGLEEAVGHKLHAKLVAKGACRTSEDQLEPAAEKTWVKRGLCPAKPGESFQPFAPVGRYVYPYVHPYLELSGFGQRWNMFAPLPPLLTNMALFEVEEDDGTWRTFAAYSPEAIEAKRRWYILKILRDFFTRPRWQPLVERLAYLECNAADIASGRRIRIRSRFYTLPIVRDTVHVDWWKEHWSEAWNDEVRFVTRCTALK